MRNVCIVGYGAIGPIHAKALSVIDEANFYAVCDTDISHINVCKEKYDVISYTDYSTMLNDADIDTVHICTPHYLHYEMVKLALEKGKKVVCEKPIAMKKDEFESMLKLPDIDKVVIVFQNRLNACVNKMKELLDNKTYGNINGVRGLVTWCRNKEYYTKADWRGKWETEGGGVLINQTIHTLDMMGYLTGGFTSLKANMMNFSLKGTIEVEDTFVASLRTKNNAKAIFFATNAYSSNSLPDIEVVCENATLHYTDGRLFVNSELVCEDSLAIGEKSYWGKGHAMLFHNYYSENRYFNIYDAENTMKTVYAMYDSAKNNGKELYI